MDVVWIVLGALLLVLSMLDTFFTVLNYNERGLFVNRFIRVEWRLVRWLISKTSITHRHWFLRQVTGLVLISAISVWLFGILLGYALIFYGAIGMGAVTSTHGAAGFWDAVYLSIGQFATVGVEHISAVQRWTEILTVVETMTSIVFLSMTITFLANIYNAIQALRTLCASFPSSSNAVTSPLDSLEPFFPYGTTNSLELHLIDSRVNMNGYFDSLAQDHSGYFFQSGSDRFAMPFAVFNLAGTIEGLRYGLPKGHPASRRPELTRLEDSFDGCLEQIRGRYDWPHPADPAPLGLPEFTKSIQEWQADPNQANADAMVVRFAILVKSMATMEGIADPFSPDQLEELHQRYKDWLVFVTNVDAFLTKASADLLYRPYYSAGTYPFEPPIADFGWRSPAFEADSQVHAQRRLFRL